MVYIDPHTFSPLTNVHHPNDCRGRGCPLHHPSEHFMAGWDLDWDRSRKQMYRVCEHNHNHPDPDDAAFRIKRLGSKVDDLLLHSCDGCCGYELPTDTWLKLGTVQTFDECTQIAKELRLADKEWFFDSLRATLLLRNPNMGR